METILSKILISLTSVALILGGILGINKIDDNKQNLGATIVQGFQGGTGISTTAVSNNGKYLKVSTTTPYLVYTFDMPAGGSGGSTTTIAGLQPNTDVFILNSTSGIVISTSSPDTIIFNLGIATTTQLAITSLAGQGGCLSVNAAGKVATSTCSGGTGLTSLNSQTGSTQTFSTSTDTNIQLRIVSSANDHQFTPVWAGTLADSRIASAGTWNSKITTTSLSVAYPPLAFNNTTGVFTLPTSTASQSGFLSSGDWTTFNNKVGTSRAINTGFALSGGGDLSADRTIFFSGSFATSGNANIIIASSSGTWTFSQATSTGSVNGFLSSADWNTFNGKQNNITWPIVYASSTHLTASLPLLITAGDLSLTGRLSTINSITTTTGNLIVGKTDTTGWYSLGVGSNGKVLTASSTATNGVSWETIVASASAGGSDTNLQVNEAGAIAGYSGLTFTSSTNTLSVSGLTTSTNIYSTTATTTTLCLGSDCKTAWPTGGSSIATGTIPFIIEYPSSPEDIYFSYFPTAATGTNVYVVNKTNGDSVTFNLGFANSRTAATTTLNYLFSSFQTITATTTPTTIAVNGSSTIPANSVMRVIITNGSSTQFGFNLYYNY